MGNYCGAQHPNISIVVCEKPGEGKRLNHEFHTAYYHCEFIDWPNDNYVAPKGKLHSKSDKNKGLLKAIAERIKNNESSTNPNS